MNEKLFNISLRESKNKNLVCKLASVSEWKVYKLLGTHSYLRRRLFQFPELNGHRTRANPGLTSSSSRCRFTGITAPGGTPQFCVSEKFLRKRILLSTGTLHTHTHMHIASRCFVNFTPLLFGLWARNVHAMWSETERRKNNKNENEVHKLS